MTALLDVRGLSTWFRSHGPLTGGNRWKKAVDDVSFTLERGQTLAIIGESGSGKTTLALTLLGLATPRAGQVLFDSVDLLRLRPHAWRPYRRRLQLIFQDTWMSLDPEFDVRRAVAEGLDAFGIGSPEERGALVDSALVQVGIDPVQYGGRIAQTLSGGQRQRVAIARAIVLKPDLLVCDEPTSALDLSIQAQIVNVLLRLRNEVQVSYLFITHNISLAAVVADRIAVMFAGRIVEQGPADVVLRSPAHPYTRDLIAARPGLPGIIPSPSDSMDQQREQVPLALESRGCPYAPRCEHVMEHCWNEVPAPHHVGRVSVRCLLYSTQSTASTINADNDHV